MQNAKHIWLWIGTMEHLYYVLFSVESLKALFLCLNKCIENFISCINNPNPCYLSLIGVFKNPFSLIAYFTKLLKLFCKICFVFAVLPLQLYTLSFLVHCFKMMSECGSKNKYKKRIKMVVEFLWVYFYLSVFVRLLTGVKCDFLLFFFYFWY